ncbi:Uma2 family endonuclease [Calothrix sp. NIES-3974]|uniref:Uma2 family endonuclease n=1 Tax=Calothrix sp. NIES-3974 TaxID=2005462 RepID=UPI000B61FA18|nr:Uma2 family endonuclease [Calothrix sp. NIES-3974]BAZ07793.1 hypothetical protein NIES3974_44580 [Calothrix sp. NIES-3974]
MANNILVKRFSLEEYHKLTELGFFHEDEHLELIRGEILQMSAKGRAHETCLRNLLRELPRLIGERATLQSQAPITLLTNSEPEPDFAIIYNRDDNYLSAHPTSRDILLLMEVSDSSLEYDKSVKLPLYAEAGISDYWIFNLVDYHLEAYHEPYQDSQGKFGYLYKQICLPHQTIKIPCFPELEINLNRIFPGRLRSPKF